MVGMGASSRPRNFSKDYSPQDVITYFTYYMEKWRKALPKYIEEIKGKKFTQFVILGHSFGGYLSGHYTVKYPEHVKKLILLSPVGILDYPYSHDSRRKVIQSTKFLRDLGLQDVAWTVKISSMDVMRLLGPA